MTGAVLRPMRRWRPLAALLVSACDRRIEVLPPPCVLAPGDSAQAVAAVVRGANVFSAVDYASVERPRAFRWSTSDSGVVTVLPDGTLIGRGPGSASIRAATDGMAQERTVRVAAPVTAVSVRPRRAVLKVGDTIAVRFDVADSAASGRIMPSLSAPFARPVSIAPDDSFLPTRIVAAASGSAIVTWCAAGRSGLLPVRVDQ